MNINNPVFSAFENTDVCEHQSTMRGIIFKTSLLLLITIISAVTTITLGLNSYGWIFGTTFIGMIAVIIGRTNPQIAHIASIVYSVAEGIVLGLFSGIALQYPEYSGVVSIAIVGTIVIFGTMLILYLTKLVAATPTLNKVLYGIGIALLMFMLSALVLSVFGFSSIMNMFSSSPSFTALLSVIIITYGSFMLVLNFNEAQTYVDNGLDKRYEWIASLGLIVTILYIYLQVLRFAMVILRKK